jgi:hypothetical protein
MFLPALETGASDEDENAEGEGLGDDDASGGVEDDVEEDAERDIELDDDEEWATRYGSCGSLFAAGTLFARLSS